MTEPGSGRGSRSRGQVLWDAVRHSREPAATPGQMVRDLYGQTVRGRPDTRAAAQELGVSQRTVQRWLQQGLPARSDAAGALAQRHGGWRASAAGRRARMGPRREQRLRSKGGTVVFLGKVAVSADPRNGTQRSFTTELNGDQLGPILDAALDGRDTEAFEIFQDTLSGDFGGQVELDPDDLRLT